ncbi:MAG: transglycosylase SLT domain-containing protein [Bacteroidales bacterium]|nr:transglycosylase SLT domain-containing protein [Bacteroidales bacterium]
MKNKAIYLIFLMFLGVSLSAQDIDNTEFFTQFERNYDSLLHRYYVRQNSKFLTQRYNSNNQTYSPRIKVADLPDSVIANRLRKIPSAIELTYNDKVRSHIIYYVDKIGDRVGVMLGLSKYYFPIFENILDKAGVPEDLKYLVIIESALNPTAVSRAGATGLWQFMHSTGKMYDLRINSVIDDRRDPIKATYAAARYLRDLYKIYGDWTLALAAYNCGPGNVNKAIRRSGKDTFWGMYDYLPRETRGYVPAYIAAVYAMTYYQEHGIEIERISKPLHLISDTVMLSKDIHFKQIEEVMNISIEELREMNPQYKMDMIPGSQDRYSLKLPLTYINDFISLEDSISNYKKEEYFGESKVKNSQIANGEIEYRERIVYHKIRKNETWASISKRYGVSVKQLKSWNKKASKRKYLRVGDLLTIHRKEAYRKEVKTEETQTPTNFNTEIPIVSSENEAINTQTSAEEIKENIKGKKPEQHIVNHTVKKGETIAKIAKKYGVSVNQICKLNGLTQKQASRIKIGQKLRVK